MSFTLSESANVGCISTFALISPVEMKCRRNTNTSVSSEITTAFPGPIAAT